MFFVIEGVDGSGKSEVCIKLRERFLSAQKRILLFKETIAAYENCIISKNAIEILKCLYSLGGTSFSTATNMWIAARMETLSLLCERIGVEFNTSSEHHLVPKELEEALRSKDLVVMYDRYVSSTIVYQGRSSEEYSMICDLHSKFNIPMPDKTFVLNVGVDVAMERIGLKHVKDAAAIFDYDKFSVVEKGVKKYNDMLKGLIPAYSRSVIGINAENASVESIVDEIYQNINQS